jgi:hypothetical protein
VHAACPALCHSSFHRRNFIVETYQVSPPFSYFPSLAYKHYLQYFDKHLQSIFFFLWWETLLLYALFL